jgi:hypothetical protein
MKPSQANKNDLEGLGKEPPAPKIKNLRIAST